MVGALLTVGVLASSAGFFTGRYVANDDLKQNDNANAQSIIERQDTFAACVFAVLFVEPDERRGLTDEAVAAACNVDIGQVRDRRRLLREHSTGTTVPKRPDCCG